MGFREARRPSTRTPNKPPLLGSSSRDYDSLLCVPTPSYVFSAVLLEMDIRQHIHRICSMAFCNLLVIAKIKKTNVDFPRHTSKPTLYNLYLKPQTPNFKPQAPFLYETLANLPKPYKPRIPETPIPFHVQPLGAPAGA